MFTFRLRRTPVAAFALTAALAFQATTADAQEWAGRGRLQGSLKDEDGKPVVGAKLTFRKGSEKVDAALPGPAPVESNDKGRWSIGGLAGGLWSVVIEKQGYLISEGQLQVNEFAAAQPATITMKKPSAEMLAAEAQAAANDETRKALEAGNTFMQNQQWTEARTEYEKALTKLTDAKYQAQVLRAIGQTYSMQQQYPKAIETLERAKATDSTDADTLNLLAQTYYQANQAEKAIEMLKASLQARPADPATTKMLVDLLVDAGREEESKQFAALVPEGVKVDPVSLLNLGIRAYNDGKYDRALESFNRVVTENPEMAEAYYYRALAYMPTGKMNEAKADFKKFLEIAPTHAKAKEAKEMLDAM
jgi:tetratricopeptide (TPR) repeat protein